MNRDLVIVMLGRVLQMAVLLAMLRAMTTRLSPLEVGNYSLLVSIANLFIWVLISPVGLYVNRHTHEWWKAGTIWFNYGREGLYGSVVAFFTAGALWLWEALFSPSWGQHMVFLGPAVGLYIIFALGNNTIIPAINLLGERISYSVLYVGSQLLCLAFSWFISGLRATGEAWFIGQAAGFALASLCALPIFLRATKPLPGSDRGVKGGIRAGLHAITFFCLPIVLTSGLTWVQFQSYRVVIGDLVSLEFLGLFFAGYSVSAGLMGAVEITAGQFFGPYFYKHIQEAAPGQQHDAWAAYMSALYPIMIVIVMVVVAMAVPITHMLLARKFWAASSYVAVGALVEAVRVMGGTYALAAHVSKRTRVLLVPYSVGAISTVIALLGGTWFFGERAVIPAMTLSAFAFLGTMHVTMMRHSGTRFSILGWPWIICVGVFLALLALLKPFLSGLGSMADLISVAVGGAAILVAFLLVLRDAQPTLSRFAK